LLLLFALSAFQGLVHFTVWLFTGGMGGLSAAGLVVLDLLAVAYLARYILVAVEASAEGYDMAPGPPDPREVEEIFGGFLKLLAVLFFSLLPSLLLAILSIRAGPVPYLVVAIGTLYLPMGLLAMAVTGDLTGSFPGTVLPSIFMVPHRYLPSALLGAGAGVLVYLCHAGALSGLPVMAKVGLDAGAAWLLMAVLHRMGVLHREETSLQALMRFPQPEPAITEHAVPPRRMTEIERIIADRDRNG
jgi:hypothetical protein